MTFKIEYPGIIDIYTDESIPHIDLFNNGDLIINDKGLYGDWLINKFCKEEILEYPTIEFIKNNIKDLMKNKKYILLLDSQKEEINFLKSVFPIKDLKLDMDLLLEALGINLDLGDIWDLAKTKIYYRILYFILRYNFNPSYMFNLNLKEPTIPYIDDIKKLNLPFSSEYFDKGDVADQRFAFVALDLAYIDDLMSQGVELKEIIKDNLISKETHNWLIENEKIKKTWKYSYLNMM